MVSDWLDKAKQVANMAADEAKKLAETAKNADYGAMLEKTKDMAKQATEEAKKAANSVVDTVKSNEPNKPADDVNKILPEQPAATGATAGAQQNPSGQAATPPVSAQAATAAEPIESEPEQIVIPAPAPIPNPPEQPPAPIPTPEPAPKQPEQPPAPVPAPTQDPTLQQPEIASASAPITVPTPTQDVAPKQPEPVVTPTTVTAAAGAPDLRECRDKLSKIEDLLKEIRDKLV